MTVNNHIGKERQPVTAAWRNGGCSASYDSFVVGSSAVLRLSFCAKKPRLRQYPNRYMQCGLIAEMLIRRTEPFCFIFMGGKLKFEYLYIYI